jgi:CheY-like chemotaxis protein
MSDSTAVTILLVDDDEGHTELVRRNLVRAGLHNRLVTLASGDAALEHLLGEGSDGRRGATGELLVLLDINMPGLDGVEVLRRLKEDPRTHHLPVIMLTTTDDPLAVRRCYELGCNVYVTKPVDPPRFIEAVHRLGLFLPVVALPRGGAS